MEGKGNNIKEEDMTDEDKKLILEWCGFYQLEGLWTIYDEDVLLPPDPDLDLNVYFKYAVPKLRYASLQHSDQYQGAISAYYAQVSIQFGNNYASADDDPAEAFGQALLKLIKRGEQS